MRMRTWKNKKGLSTYLVLIVSSLTLGNAAGAKDPVLNERLAKEGGTVSGIHSLDQKAAPIKPVEAKPVSQVPIEIGELLAQEQPPIDQFGQPGMNMPPMPSPKNQMQGNDGGMQQPPFPPMPESARPRPGDANPPFPQGPPNQDRGQPFAPDANAPSFPPEFLDANQMDPGNTIGLPPNAPPPAQRRRPGMPGRAPGQNAPIPSATERPRGAPNARNNSRAPSANDSEIYHVVPQKCVPAKGEFTWNFEDEELFSVLRQVSDLLCRTFAVDALGKNLKMTIIGKSSLNAKDAWDILVASLAAKGFSVVQQGKVWTVIKRGDLKSYPTPIYSSGKQAGNNEEIGTLFYKVNHTSQDVLKNVARVLISKEGLVESVGDHFIIVIDSNSNIRRLGTIFAQVDIEDAINKIHIVSLHNADAKTVEKQLRDLFDIQAGTQRGSRKRRPGAPETKAVIAIDKIIADERTNSLIVIADKDSIDKLREVVALVDQPASDQGSKGKIHVKKLRFADAKKIAETLNAVVQQGKSGRFGRRRDEGTTELFEGEVKVTANESTNSLVTVASANDYRSLLDTINQLDERKEQVYIEGAILDIGIKDDNQFGINLFSGMNASIPGVAGDSLGLIANPGGKSIAEEIKKAATSSISGSSLTENFGTNSLGALAVLGNFLNGGVAGIVGPVIPGTKIPSFGAVLQAFSENSNVDVLSTPYLLTTDNQEAEMSVGDKIPVIRGASQLGGGLGGGLGVSHNIQHEDVKLTFKVTPHVGADDNVRLDIVQEVNEIGNKFTILNQEQYSIRTKSAKTQLVLKDQQTGVIGGLIHHSVSSIDNKVPFLGDIPILNLLFKKTTKNNNRRSLLLIVTPYIIRTEEDYKKVLDRKFKEREEFARLYYGGKIRNYNPHIDYDKKEGPLARIITAVDQELKKSENGGPGDGSEVIIKPKDNGPAKNIEIGPDVNLMGPSDNSMVFMPPDSAAEQPTSNDLGDFAMPEVPNFDLAEEFGEGGQ